MCQQPGANWFFLTHGIVEEMNQAYQRHNDKLKVINKELSTHGLACGRGARADSTWGSARTADPNEFVGLNGAKTAWRPCLTCHLPRRKLHFTA